MSRTKSGFWKILGRRKWRKSHLRTLETSVLLEHLEPRLLLSTSGFLQEEMFEEAAGHDATAETVGLLSDITVTDEPCDVGQSTLSDPLFIPLDETFTPWTRNDDGSTEISLGFSFGLYGNSYNRAYINNNGFLSFGQSYDSSSPADFPNNDCAMVAPFWADVDTRPDESGVVHYRLDSEKLVVIWDDVGYYAQHTDKLNRFEVIISDGTDPDIGISNNVCFSYGDMQWTTGGAAGGSNGFGGIPATVGINRGDGVDYKSIGRFDHEGTDYDGPSGASDGVSYLDDTNFFFNLDTNTVNIAPVPSGFPSGYEIDVTANTTLELDVSFLSPEPDQTTTTVVDSGGLDNLSVDIIDGNTSTVTLTYSPLADAVGEHVIHLMATDDYTPSAVTDVYLAVNVVPDITGPHIIGMTPPMDGTGTGTTPQIVLEFDSALQESSAEDIANYTVTLDGTTSISVDSATWDGPTNTVTLELNGGAPLPEGGYGINVEGDTGGIVDADGYLLDGDNNLIPGGDFNAAFIIERVGPWITSHVPQGTVHAPLSFFNITFSEDIRETTFDSSDIVITGPSGAVTPTDILHIGGNTYRVSFPDQTIDGDYDFAIGPHISDLAGNWMDQDQDGIHDEPVDDIYTFTLTTDGTGPRVTDFTPTGTLTSVVDQVRVTFSEALNAATFSVGDLRIVGPDGSVVLTSVEQINPQAFAVHFAAQTAEGHYEVGVGPYIYDLVGNAMDQDEDGTGGEPLDDIYHAAFDLNMGPQVVGSQPSGLVQEPISHIDVTFNEDIDLAEFTAEDVVLTGPSGSIGITDISLIDGTTYRLEFAEQSAEGIYSVEIGPYVLDMSGNDMDQDQDGLFGENPDDIYTSSFSIESTGPGPVGDLAFAENTGVSDSDHLTNDFGLVFSWTEPYDPSGIAGYEYRLDGGGWIAVSQTSITLILDEGDHTFEVYAIDNAGNPGDVASVALTLDLTGPAAITGMTMADDTGALPDDGLTNDDTPTFSWDDATDDNGIWKYQYKINTGTWTDVFDTSVTLNPTDGQYTFTVRAVDNAGNTGDSSDVFNFEIDTTAPAAPDVTMVDDTGTSHSDGLTNDTELVFSWTEPYDLNGIEGYEYQLDDGGWVAISETSIPLTMDEGSHTFEVRAIDCVDNHGEIATLNVTVDTTAPGAPAGMTMADDTGALPDDGLTNDDTPTFSWDDATDDNGIWRYQYSLDGGNWRNVYGTSITRYPTAGQHTFAVRAVDNAGNTGDASDTFNFEIDTTGSAGPTDVTMADDTGSSPDDGITNDDTPTFSWSPSPAGDFWKYQYRIDDGDWNDVFDTFVTLPSLEDGEYTFEVRAVDNAGNPSLQYDAALEWTRTYDSPAHDVDEGIGVAIDAGGNIYVSGYETRSDLGQDKNIWLRKYNEDGNTLWTRTHSADGWDIGSSVAVNTYGDVYVGGREFISGQWDNIWLRKYTSNGDELWTRTHDGQNHKDDAIYDLAIDPDGGVYAAGYENRDDISQAYNIWLRKYDADGNTEWTQTYDNVSHSRDVALGVTLDFLGNVYVTGYERRNDLGQDDNIWLRKYDTNGNTLWTETYDSPTHSRDIGYGVATDADGNIFVTGYEQLDDLGQPYDAWLRKYGSEGNVLWTRTYDSPAHGWDKSFSVAVDTAGNVYVTGTEKRDDLGQDFNIWIRKYDNDGGVLWIETYDGPAHGSEAGFGIAVDEVGNVYVTGNSNDDVVLLKYSQTEVPSDVFNFRIDTTGPDAPANLAVADDTGAYGNDLITKDDTLTFTWSEPADAGGIWYYQYRLDGGDWIDAFEPFVALEPGEGTYSFDVRAVDVAGNTGDILSESFTIDFTSPTVIGHWPDGMNPEPVEYIDVTFGEEIDESTLTVDALTLEAPSGLVANPGFSISHQGGNTYRISFAAQNENGLFHLYIAPVIADIAGNLMADQYDAAFEQSLVDLTVFGVVTVTSGSPGEEIQVEWTVSNVGTGATTATWHDGIYLSDNDSWSADDELLGSFAGEPLEGSGGLNEYHRSETVTIPQEYLTEDTYYILVYADYVDTLLEMSEANNVSGSPIDILLADLVPSIVSLPADALTGEQMEVTVRADNTGNGAAMVSWTDGLYWSSVQDGTDEELWSGGSGVYIPLISGDGYEFSLTITVPDVEIDGTYYLTWATDVDDVLLETSELNNIVSQAINVTRTSELSIAQPVFTPNDPVIGEIVQIEALVANNGPADSPASTVMFYLGDPDNGGQPIGSAQTPELADAETFLACIDWDTTGLPIGEVTIYAVVDPDDVVIELNENDNTTSASIQVDQPLLMTNWLLPDEFEAGQQVEVTLQITNDGERNAEQVDVTFTEPLPAGVTLVSSNPAPDGPGLTWSWSSIAAEQTIQIQITLDLDYLLSGEISIPGTVIFTDRNGGGYDPLDVTLPMWVTADNTQPAVLVEITPIHTSGTQVQVRVEANEPVQDTPIVTARDSNSNLLGVSYDGQDGDEFLFTVDVTGAAEGDASVQAVVIDQIGNGGSATATFLVDRTEPTYAVSLVGQLLGAGSKTLIVTPSELLATEPTVVVTDSNAAPIEISSPTKSGVSYYYTLTIHETTGQGQADISVSGQDLTGNASLQSEIFYIDSIAPTFTVNAPTLFGLGTFDVIVSPDEVLPVSPTVEVTSAGGAVVEVMPPGFDGSSYTYSVRTRTGTANGEATITVSATDAAGNLRTEVLAAQIDTVAPELEVTVNPDPPRGGGSVLIQVTADETLSETPQLTASLDGQTALPLDPPTQTGNTYEWVCPVDELAVVSVTATDLAGNETQEVLTYADLSAATEDLTLSNIPYMGMDVTAEAIIRNMGQTRVENILVRFYEGTFLPTTQLGPDQYVSLNPGEFTTVSELWPATSQVDNNIIFAIVDPDDILAETDETNNIAMRGPVLLYQVSDKMTYLLSETIGEFWVVPYDSSNMRLLADDEASVDVWIEDENGAVVSGPWAAVYDVGDERFEIIFDPSALSVPETYEIVAEATGAAFAPADARTSILLIHDFSITTETDASIYDRGDLVNISGYVQNVLGDPIANMPVSLVMTARYGTRLFTVTTDDDGYYNFPYQPNPMEAGGYEVTATLTQGEIERSGSTAFEIRGLYLQAQRNSTRVIAGDSQELTYRITNLGTSSLTGLNVTLSDMGGTGEVLADLDLTGTASFLNAGQDTTFTVQLLAGQTLGDHTLNLSVTAAEGSAEQVDLSVEVYSSQPSVRFDPPQLETTVPRGGQITREIVVTNTGWEDVLDAALVPNAPDWVTLMGGSLIIGRLPGQKGLSEEGFGLFDRYSLLCKIGPDGEVRQVGTESAFNADGTGELFFRINEEDAQLFDNSGQISAKAFIQGITLPETFGVAADQGWQASGVSIVKGQQVRIEADGIWHTGPDSPRDAAGNGAVRYSLMWAPEAPGLIGASPFDWTIHFTGSNISDEIMYLRSWVIAAENGSATITVTNPLGEPLEEAQVTLYGQQYDPVSQSFPTYVQTTDDEGRVEFTDMSSGPYRYMLSREGYLGDTGTIDVEEGLETDTVVVLNPDAVSIEWFVEETTITDHYDLTLRTTYRVEEGEPLPPILLTLPVEHTIPPDSFVDGDVWIWNEGERPATNVILTRPLLNMNLFGIPISRDADCQFWFVVTDNMGQTSLADTITIDCILPGESVNLNYRISMNEHAQIWDVFNGFVHIEYNYVDLNGVHVSESSIPVRIDTPDDNLIISPRRLYVNTTHQIGWDQLGVLWENLGKVTIKNSPDSINTVDSFSKAYGLLFNVGFSITDLYAVLGGPVSLIAKLGLKAVEIVGLVSVVEGQYIFPSGEDHRLEPGENCTMSFRTPTVKMGFEQDLVSLRAGHVVFAANWYSPENQPISTTFYDVPIIITSVGKIEGGVTVERHLPDVTGGREGGGRPSIWTWPTISTRHVPPPPLPDYVTFDIHQDVTFDRQAFTGTLVINNDSETTTLENLRVDIEIADENGYVLSTDHREFNELYFAAPGLDGLTDIDGGGYLGPQSEGTVEWLIIPTLEAGDKTYQLTVYVTGDWEGAPAKKESLPAVIYVAPQPEVQLDYYIQPRFGAGEPFYLGLQATNKGEGPVHNLLIETDQPEIVWGKPKIQGIDRWWAYPSETFSVDLDVHIACGGEYRLYIEVDDLFDLDDLWMDAWRLETNSYITIDDSPTQYYFSQWLNSAYATFSEYEVGEDGEHTIHIHSFVAPNHHVVEPITFRLNGPWGSNDELATMFVCDRPGIESLDGLSFEDGFGGALSVATLQELAETYAPTMYFSEGEHYHEPVEVEVVTEDAGTSLRSSRGDVLSNEIGSVADARGYLDFYGQSPEEYRPSGTGREKVYASVVPDLTNNRLAINYWFFYAYSNWKEHGGFNTHEGDWEGITVFLERESSSSPFVPTEVAYAQHEMLFGGPAFFLDGGQRVVWDHAVSDNSSHPNVYVGLGSHASYFFAGATPWGYVMDEHWGNYNNGSAIDYTLDLLERAPELDGTSDSWALFPGRWGQPGLPGGEALIVFGGNDGPKGPLFNGPGGITNLLQLPGFRWYDPWGWASDFDQWPWFGQGSGVPGSIGNADPIAGTVPLGSGQGNSGGNNAHVQIDEAYLVEQDGSVTQMESLSLPFGTLEPGETKTGWWTLRAWPGGEVVDFHVHSLEHDEALGGKATSLLSASTHTHWVTYFGLVNDAPTGTCGTAALVDWDTDGIPDTLLDTTDSSTYDVTVVVSEVTQLPTFELPEMHVTLEKVAGWIYTAIPDPFAGSLQISEIVAAGERILDPRNYWVEDGVIHVVDDPAEEYVIVFETQPIQETETGSLQMNQIQYAGFGATATVTLSDIDADANFGPYNDTLSVQVASAPDTTGEIIILTETGLSGVFTGTFGFEETIVAGNGKVGVSRGCLVTTTYEDAAGDDGLPVTVTAQAQWVTYSVPVTLSLDTQSDTGTLGDNITNDITPTLIGQTGSLADVAIEITGPGGYSLLGAAQADASGYWDYTVDSTDELVDGAYEISVSATDQYGNESEEEETLTLTVDTLPPVIEAIMVNDGSDQRSMVTNVEIHFSEDTSITASGTFINGLVNGNNLASGHTHADYNPATHIATLTFDTNADPDFGESLLDDRYDLVLDCAGITDAAGNPLSDTDGVPDGQYTYAFHRFFGDSDGDADVDNSDLLELRQAFGKVSPDPAYNWAFDHDQDGDVDASNLFKFRSNFGNVLDPAPTGMGDMSADDDSVFSAIENVSPLQSDNVQPSIQNPVEDTNPRVRARNKRHARLLKHSISAQSAPTVDILRGTDTPAFLPSKKIALTSVRMSAREQRVFSGRGISEISRGDTPHDSLLQSQPDLFGRNRRRRIHK